jgi:hypothetical protein
LSFGSGSSSVTVTDFGRDVSCPTIRYDHIDQQSQRGIG